MSFFEKTTLKKVYDFISFVNPRKSDRISEREDDTQSKVERNVANSIQHYFEEFKNQDSDYATYFFRDPDVLYTDKSMESDMDFDGRSSFNQTFRQNSFQDQRQGFCEVK